MVFPGYLKDQLPELVISLLAILLVGETLGLCGIHGGVVQLTVATLLFAETLRFLVSFGRRRRFLLDMAAIAARSREGEGARVAAGALAPTHLAEGALVEAALAAVEGENRAALTAARDDGAAYRDFIELWSHEVKTPLAAATLMVADHPGELARDLAPELELIGHYVDQALFFARSYGVSQDYLVRPVDLEVLVRDAVKDRMRLLMGVDASLELVDLHRTVYTDAKWMGFVLGQLIDNAAKYARPGVQPTLTFSATTEEGGSAQERVMLRVRDNGIGIPAHDLDRVFDKGFVGENGRDVSRARSTGIGLYLVRTLCAKMGLQVEVRSDGATWTCVSIAFPREARFSEGE